MELGIYAFLQLHEDLVGNLSKALLVWRVLLDHISDLNKDRHDTVEKYCKQVFVNHHYYCEPYGTFIIFLDIWAQYWCWLIDRLIDRSINRSIDWLIDWWMDWLMDWVIEWMIEWMIDWLIVTRLPKINNDWMNDWLIDWLIDDRNQM